MLRSVPEPRICAGRTSWSKWTGRTLVSTVTLLLSASVTVAQGFSPFLPRSGSGPYDAYRDALLCSVVLDHLLGDPEEGSTDARHEAGWQSAYGFAGFILGTGNVVDANGTNLWPDHLPTGRLEAEDLWRRTTVHLSGEQVAIIVYLEAERCLGIYGTEWDDPPRRSATKSNPGDAD